jgi:hypothetical protein
VTAAVLLRRAAAVYDAPGCPLPAGARGAWRGGFAGGGRWMALALATLRGTPPAPPPAGLNRLGLIKYGVASTAALAWVGVAWATGWPVLAPAAVLVFYAVEAQAVFLFPLALDGHPASWREARRLTAAAGGTLAVMAVVLPLAAVMLLGGFAGRGFVRCWCLGCLAVCLWYEGLRNR